ncbi:hypothetical protein [Deinococcus peraridilitoris]|uniref:hypothetical protein n=1 Tax=Deinococcus peraridilitoris TaxID=432329 RepID=UPI0002FF7F45|nr:hypothetical protein [Deinococcus peraridilitoris]
MWAQSVTARNARFTRTKFEKQTFEFEATLDGQPTTVTPSSVEAVTGIDRVYNAQVTFSEGKVIHARA